MRGRWSLQSNSSGVLWMQRLDLIVTLLLVRQRQPAMWHLGFGVLGLPSGLLAMICEALTKLESQIEARSRFSGVPRLRSLGHASLSPPALADAAGRGCDLRL